MLGTLTSILSLPEGEEAAFLWLVLACVCSEYPLVAHYGTLSFEYFDGSAGNQQ